VQHEHPESVHTAVCPLRIVFNISIARGSFAVVFSLHRLQLGCFYADLYTTNADIDTVSLFTLYTLYIYTLKTRTYTCTNSGCEQKGLSGLSSSAMVHTSGQMS
jgi:hypothetical protein